MKIVSFLGMIFSMILLLILSLLYFSVREYIGAKETIMICSGLFIGLFMLVFSLLVAKNYYFGNKNSYSPMV